MEYLFTCNILFRCFDFSVTQYRPISMSFYSWFSALLFVCLTASYSIPPTASLDHQPLMASLTTRDRSSRLHRHPYWLILQLWVNVDGHRSVSRGCSTRPRKMCCLRNWDPQCATSWDSAGLSAVMSQLLQCVLDIRSLQGILILLFEVLDCLRTTDPSMPSFNSIALLNAGR